MSGEKRAKESSDEDEKEEHKREAAQWAAAAKIVAEADQLQAAKRQKAKEKKEARKKQRQEEDDPTRPLLPKEVELRMAILGDVKPTQEDVDRAIRGDPSSHPLLRYLMGRHAEFLQVLCV